MTSPQCDAAGNDGLACRGDLVAWIEAQWTIADFGTWYACEQHVDAVERWLWARTVDGLKTEHVYVHPIMSLPM